MATNKPKHFTVRGMGDIPLDMLRYDGCFPSTGDDVNNLVLGQHYSPDERRLWMTTMREVAFTTYSQGSPTTGRWKSFGWQVHPEENVGRYLARLNANDPPFYDEQANNEYARKQQPNKVMG